MIILDPKTIKDEKYFFPLMQEVRITDNDIQMVGIFDAVFRNESDGGLILMDWKTGKYKKDNDMRKELSVYKYLFDNSDKSDEKIKYWGMYFVDQKKIFFEEVDDKLFEKIWKRVEKDIVKVREGIERKDFHASPSPLCGWCDYFDVCEIGK